MDDPSKFLNITEYNILMYAVELLFLTECAIWLFTSGGSSRHSRRSSDKGTVWLVMIAWICSFMAGAYFRSQGVSEFMRGWLLPHFFYYIGIIFIILGVIIRCTAVLTLRKSFTLSVQTEAGQHLIKTGLYRFVRNPAYTGSIISLLGVSFAYRHILGAIFTLFLCLVCYGIRINVEEKALKAQFGGEFEQYCIRTRYRLIPGIY